MQHFQLRTRYIFVDLTFSVFWLYRNLALFLATYMYVVQNFYYLNTMILHVVHTCMIMQTYTCSCCCLVFGASTALYTCTRNNRNTESNCIYGVNSAVIVLIPYFNLFRISYLIFELQRLLQACERNQHVDLKIMYDIGCVLSSHLKVFLYHKCASCLYTVCVTNYMYNVRIPRELPACGRHFFCFLAY